MKPKNININRDKDIFLESDLKHIVYDLSIEDLEERKAKAKILEGSAQVAALLGINIETVWKNRMPTKKVKGINGKMYAIRLVKNN
jgi:DNA-binding CsgD family transcriptional regulator